jgi:succinyl-diaminopimelate desuccinylase
MQSRMNEQVFVEQLGALVGFASLTGDVKQNSRALDYVDSLVDEGVVVDRRRNKDTEIYIARTSVSEERFAKYMYLVHMDVVAGDDGQFVMRQDGDRLIGRGVSDMKFSIPMGIALINEAQKQGVSLAMIITTDEEVGGFDGAKILADEGFRAEVLIVPDGGENLNFVDRAKGVCQLDITIKGRSAHASRPWLGQNANDDMAQLICKLLETYGENNKTESWTTTMNTGVVSGGISTNQVCDEARVKLDFRYPETDSIEEIEKKVSKVIKDLGIGADIRRMSTGMPTFTDTDHPEVQKYLSIMGRIYDREIVVKPTYGASDARHFAHLRVPILMHKPMGGEIHSPDEWISLSSCLAFFEGLREYLGLK